MRNRKNSTHAARTGRSPSYQPRDRHLVFARDGGEPRIEAFTALDAHILADYDSDSTCGGDDEGWGRNIRPNQKTLTLPALPGVMRLVEVKDFADLPGDKVLSLSGTPGAFRVWPAASASGAPLLGMGKTVTNTPAEAVWVEALAPGAATLTFAFTGTGVASNYACSASLDITAWGVRFVEDGTTRYNFSPSCGEAGKLRAAVTRPPPGQYGGLLFQIEIVRELAGGTDQHIDWVDMLPESVIYANTRDADFTSKLFTWSGVPHPVFGDSAPAATGRDVFQGFSESVKIKFPAVTAGQPVPPPYYTAVARIRDGNGNTLAEARKRIFVPQVVKFVYTPAAVAVITNGMYNTAGTQVQIKPMTIPEWDIQRNRIRDIAQLYYDTVGANIRFLNDGDAAVNQPFSTVTMYAVATNYSHRPYGNANPDFLNLNPSDTASLYAETPQQAIVHALTEENFIPPVTQKETGFLWGLIVAHETGHMLGLVAPNDVLKGDGGWHNKNPSVRGIMNDGLISYFADVLGRNGGWTWRGLNIDYLRFILPKEEKEQ